jgi:hypothetical protein
MLPICLCSWIESSSVKATISFRANALRGQHPLVPMPFGANAIRCQCPSGPTPFGAKALWCQSPSGPMPFVAKALRCQGPSGPMPFGAKALRCQGPLGPIPLGLGVNVSSPRFFLPLPTKPVREEVDRLYIRKMAIACTDYKLVR